MVDRRQKRPNRTVIDLVVELLRGEGVDTIIGIPGGPLMPLYEALAKRHDIRVVLAKHEGGAANMANGYARVSGRLGVCCTTAGPGATNAVTGIASAQRDSNPVLLITAQVPRRTFGKGAAQESTVHGVDLVSLFKPITKSSLMVTSVDSAASAIRSSLRSALSGRRGPVHLNLPADLMRQLIPDEPLAPHAYRTAAGLSDRRAVERASQLLAQARRPAILAGHGVYIARAWPELQALAERWSIPVATTPSAKGLLPEGHPLSLGVFGLAGSPQADGYLLGDEVDVLMTLGTSLGEAATHGWKPQLMPRESLIQVDIDPLEMGRNYPISVGVVGDAKAVLADMLSYLSADRQAPSDALLQERAAVVRDFKTRTPRFESLEGFDDESIPLHPQHVMKVLEAEMPRDSLLFSDIGNVMAWGLHHLQINQPGSFHLSLGFGAMGYAGPASIGAKLAAPDRPVMALIGDSAFAMHGLEIHTAVELDIPVVWLILNDGGHGMVRLGEQLLFDGAFSSGAFERPLSIASIARAAGARGIAVREPDQIGRAIRQALNAKRPTVIEIFIDPDRIPALKARMEIVEGFIAKA